MVGQGGFHHGQGVGSHGYMFGTPPSLIDSAPVTCQTCHVQTTDPSNTGPGGFYYLDTSGDYTIAGATNASYSCTSCHTGQAGAPLTGTGKVLPLRHVNGSRDVNFDKRTGNPNAAWVPDAIRPTRPYWFRPASPTNWGWDRVTVIDWIGVYPTGYTVQFDFAGSEYNPADKTCTNVACHMSQGNTNYVGDVGPDRFIKLQWGSTYYADGTYDPVTNESACTLCHR
jgi:hypothetical protein